MVANRTPGFVGRIGELEALDRLLTEVRGGKSAVLAIRGEAGIGKTALLTYAAEQAAGFRVAQIAGVEAEMELAFAGVHQLCGPMLDRLSSLTQVPDRRYTSVTWSSSARKTSDPAADHLVGDALLLTSLLPPEWLGVSATA